MKSYWNKLRINNAAYCVPTNYQNLSITSLDQHYVVNNRGTVILIGLIEPLSVGLAPLHITVNGFDPGPTDSGWITEEMKTHFLPMFPMGRIGLPEDAARGISFLACDDSQWITGQVIKSEGGFLGK